MIIDTINSKKTIYQSHHWLTIFDYLKSLNNNSKEGKEYLVNKHIFATVFSGKSKIPKDNILESHKKYIDIHFTLYGNENIGWFNNNLEKSSDYDTEKDAQFYHPKENPDALIKMKKGMYLIFFPGEAHMSMIDTNNCSETVKKVVIKADHNYLFNSI